MKTTPDYTQSWAELGEVRFYKEANGQWRYIHAQGEGSSLPSLDAAIAEVKAFLAAPAE